MTCRGPWPFTFLRRSALLFLLLFTSITFAQDSSLPLRQYSTDLWMSEQGFTEPTINALAQTPDGYLWIGAPGGLYRFDGVKFTHFVREGKTYIPDEGKRQTNTTNTVWRILPGRDNTLWITTNGDGLVRLKDNKFTVFTKEDGLSNEVLWGLYESSDGSIWMGTFDSKLIRLKDGKFTVYTLSQGLPRRQVREIAEDNHGNLLIATSSGLFRFKDGEFTSFFKEQGLASNNLFRIYKDSKKRVWVATDNGLSLYEDGRFINFTTEQGLTSNAIRSIAEDRYGALWIGTAGGGLNRLFNGKVFPLPAREGIYSKEVSSLYMDKEGSLWFEQGGIGLGRLKERPYLLYTTEDGLIENNVKFTHQDRSGVLWFGTTNGLVRYAGGEFQNFSTKDGLVNDAVHAVGEDENGRLWFGTRAGICLYSDGRFSVPEKLRDIKDEINFIHANPGGAIWIATKNSGLYKLKMDELTRFTDRDGLHGNDIRQVLEDSQGRVWVGAQKGLSVIEHQKVRRFDVKDYFHVRPDESIAPINTSIEEDEEKTIWFAFKGTGIVRFKNGKFSSYTMATGAYDDTILELLDDNKGGLWVCAKRGFFRFYKREFDELATGKRESIIPFSFQREDTKGNIVTNGHYVHMGTRSRDGKLWFATMNGVIVIDPASVRPNPLPPPVQIESLVVDRKSVNLSDQNYVPAGFKEIELRYAGLSLLDPLKVKFKYRLEGFDRDWIEADTRRTAYYTNLPPGHYTFRVIACNNDGVWNEEGRNLTFYLEPHFYQTGWFVVVCVCIAALLLYMLYRYRIYHLRARANELKRVAEEAVAELKVLSGLLPICASCKSIRDDNGYWAKIESYLKKNTHADFSHSVCPDCVSKLYPELYESVMNRVGSDNPSS
jgi:ligand-binding sensor domain-containing protein